MPVTTTQRSLANLRERGYLPWIVEIWNPYTHTKRDLYGFLDIVAVKPDVVGVLGIQTTTVSNLRARIKKAMGIEAIKWWLLAGNRVEFHGWKKVNNRWIADIVDF
jgi:hypothetical protein